MRKSKETSKVVKKSTSASKAKVVSPTKRSGQESKRSSKKQPATQVAKKPASAQKANAVPATKRSGAKPKPLKKTTTNVQCGENPFIVKRTDPRLLTGCMAGHVDLDLPISDHEVQLIDDHCDHEWWYDLDDYPFDLLIGALLQDAEDEGRFEGTCGIETLPDVAIRYPAEPGDLQKWESILRGIPYYAELLEQLTCPPEAAIQAILRWHVELWTSHKTVWGTTYMEFCSIPIPDGRVGFYLERNFVPE